MPQDPTPAVDQENIDPMDEGAIADAPPPSPPRQRRGVAGRRRRNVLAPQIADNVAAVIDAVATFGFVPEPVANLPAAVAPVNPVAVAVPVNPVAPEDSFDDIDQEAPINPPADEAAVHPVAATVPVNAAAVPVNPIAAEDLFDEIDHEAPIDPPAVVVPINQFVADNVAPALQNVDLNVVVIAEPADDNDVLAPIMVQPPQARRGQRVRQLPQILRPDGDTPALPVSSQRSRGRGRGSQSR